MDMLMIAQTVLFVAIPVIVMLIALLLGLKRNIFQSIAKLAMTLLAIVISVIITKLSVPDALVNSLPLIIESTGEQLPINLLDTFVGAELIKVISSIVMPTVFTVVFAGVAFIFWILYLIPKNLLSDKRLAQKTRTKQNSVDTDYTDIVLDEGTISQEAPDEAEAGRSGNNKTWWMRVGSVVLSMFSAFLVIAHLALPVSYYCEIINDVSSVGFIKESAEEILPITHSVSAHPVVKGYRAVGSPALFFFDRITTQDGAGDSTKETLKTAATITETLIKSELFTEVDAPESASNTFYAVANQVGESPFLDSIIVGILHEVLVAWEQGEAWFGVEKTMLGDIEFIDEIYVYLSGIDNASTLLTLVGDVFSMVNVSDGGLNQDFITKVLIDFSPEGLEVLETILVKAVSASDELPFEGTEKIVSGLFSAIKSIKQDTSITDEQRVQMLSDEAKVIYKINGIISGTTAADSKEIGSLIYSSKIVSDAFNDITDGGTIQDPCNLSELIEHAFIKEMVSGMEKKGATEDLQKSVLAFFGVK